MTEQNEYDYIVEQANVGADCAEFLNSNVGAYLVRRATEAEATALRALGKVDCEDAGKIRELQLAAAVPRQLIVFINDAISAGKTAQWQLEQYEG